MPCLLARSEADLARNQYSQNLVLVRRSNHGFFTGLAFSHFPSSIGCSYRRSEIIHLEEIKPPAQGPGGKGGAPERVRGIGGEAW